MSGGAIFENKKNYKGYLCYKTVTSQDASSDGHFFISYKSYVLFSRIQVFVFLTIP